MQIEIFSDGSATSEGKPGGYGWVMVCDGVKVDQGSGYMESASNNDAELQAAVQGLAAVFRHIHKPIEVLGNLEVTEIAPPEVTLVSDSRLVLGWANGSYRFKQLDKIDKYNNLQKLIKLMNVQTRWVRGHAGDPNNELCDKLANAARLKLSNEIEVKEKKAKGETLIGRRKSGVICLYYKDKLKVVDFSQNIVEDYDRDLHGARGGILEVREEKSR